MTKVRILTEQGENVRHLNRQNLERLTRDLVINGFQFDNREEGDKVHVRATKPGANPVYMWEEELDGA